MPDGVIFVAAVVGLLGVVILVHEWGHFIVAKIFGVRVDVFSIGFGKRIWGWRRGVTDYRLSILPLGGYVKMAGDNPMEERAGAPDEFLSKPRWQRAVIAVAGPAMNVVLAFVLLFAMYLSKGIPRAKYLDWPVEVVGFFSSPAGMAGLRPGDRIGEMGGVQNPTWEQAQNIIQNTPPNGQLLLVVERGEKRVPVELAVANPADPWSVLGDPPLPPVVDEVVAGGPADRAGLRSGDRILEVGGSPIAVFGEFTQRVRASDGRPLSLLVQRGEERVTTEVTPARASGASSYRVGMVNRIDSIFVPVGTVRAAEESWAMTWFVSRQVVGVVVGLFQGKVSIRELGGVIEIGSQAGRAAKEGMVRFVQLTVIISLNLAILNLLPIPILDGGHLLMLSIEGLMRRDLSLAVKERFVQVGFVFLMLIFAVVMYNDILKRIPKSWW